MSHPPGTPDPNAPGEGTPVDPWATPTGDPVGRSEPRPPAYPAYAQPPVQAYPAYAQPPVQAYPAYGQPAYGQQLPTNGTAQAAMWTGIGMLVLVFCCGAGILGIVPIVLGVKARGEIRRTGGRRRGAGLALTGIITGAVAVVLSILVIAALVWALAGNGSSVTTYGTADA
ncbi:MAG: DUF4190 domain-containing protein [Nocardioidaceae bacterium]